MKTFSIILIVLLISSVLPYHANADFTVEQYMKGKEREDFQLYLKGLTHGIYWANTVLEAKGSKPLYCAPVTLQYSNYMEVLDKMIDKMKKIKGHKPSEDYLIELLLIYGLIETFPCK